MRVVLGADLGDGGFPGPLGARDAVLDEAWVDLAGLVGLLEIRLGIARRDPPTEAERAAALAQVLRAATGAPWARSLEVDPLATAREVVRLKDALTLAGITDDVDSDRLPPRLAAVHRLARPILPGIPDRALACLQALAAGGHARIEELVQVDDTDALPLLTRRLLAALGADGTSVERQAAAPIIDERDTDLAAARGRGDAVYVGDGSLVLWRPDTIDDAAAEVALAIARLPRPIVVIGGDAVLDEALSRVGASTLGARGDVGSDALLSLLPLVVALGEAAVDPDRLYEAASLPISLFPRGLSGKVRRILQDAPSAQAPAILEAVQHAVADRSEKHGDDAGRALADRLATLVPTWAPSLQRPVATIHRPDGRIDVGAVRDRGLVLLQLLAGRQRRDFGDDEKTPYRAAMRQVGLFVRLLDSLGSDSLTPPQLARLVRSATSSVRAQAPWPASSGLVSIARPGAVLGPAPSIVWWGFTRESGRLPSRTLTAHEAHALRALGGDSGGLDAVAANFAAATRRPLMAAQERLILVAPRRGATGREHHPHALWDEILARAPLSERRAAMKNLLRPDEDGARGLVMRVPPTKKTAPTPRPLHIIPPDVVLPREVSSPSREERLLGCGLHFLLAERGASARPLRVKRGLALEGEVAHAVLRGVLTSDLTDQPDDAIAALARATFDDVVPTLAGAWIRPGQEQVRLRMRERSVRAAVALVALMRDNGFSIVAVEEEVTREVPTLVGETTLPRIMKGTPDVVMRGLSGGQAFPFIIDHKTGKEDHRRRLLQLGVPLQLLVYARIVGDKASGKPGIGYFIIRSGRLLTTDERVRGAERIVSERELREGWLVLEASRREAFVSLARGEVRAPGADLVVPREIEVRDGRVVIAPPCQWCRADVVCGAFAKERTHA